MNLGSTITFISLATSLSSILFSYLAFRRKELQDNKNHAKTEGVMISDIGYIKACIDRVEKNLNTVDERYLHLSERLTKVEESLTLVNRLMNLKEMWKYGI